MHDFLQYQRTILRVSLVMGGAVAILLWVLLKKEIYPIGLLAGLIAGVIKLRMDVVAILQWSNQDNQENARPLVRTHFHTYLLSGAALLAAVLMPQVLNVWAVVGGLFVPRLVLIADGLLHPAVMAGAATGTAGADGSSGDAHEA